VVGKLLKLKEKHVISQDAMYEVVELVQMICDNTAANALSAIMLLGDESGFDTTSHFFQQLPGIHEGLNSPLASIGTTYRQQSYIAQNLPYVVR
jgi:purine nucleoside permease